MLSAPASQFNNHAGSTKSYDYVREHNQTVNKLDYLLGRAPITVDYAPGTLQIVEQHDGSKLVLRKLKDEYNVSDRVAAMNFLARNAAQGQIVTGLLYVDSEPEDLHLHLQTVERPLNTLGDADLCPCAATLEKINASLR